MKLLKIVPLLACAALAACATGGGAVKIDDARTLEEARITGIGWILLEIRSGNEVTILDRAQMSADQMGDWFTLRLEKDRVSGRAAPNNYNGPCEWGAGGTLSFGLMVSTKMMAFKEPEALNEYQFFRYLEKVNRCVQTTENRLELYTTGENGVETVLVFGKQS